MKILASLNPLNKERSVIYLIALLIGAMSTPTANAGGYYRNGCYYSYPIVEKRVEIVKKVVPVYQLEFVKIPINALSYYPVTINSSYNVSVASENYVNVPQPYAVPVAAAPIAYQPVYQGAVNYSNTPLPKAKSCDEKILEMEERLLAKIDQRLTGNFQNGVSGSVMVKNCAGCHDAKDNAAKGKGHIFFENGVADEWDSYTKLKMMQMVVQQRMPPTPSKLSQDDLAQIVELLGSNGNNGKRPLRKNGGVKIELKEEPIPKENGEKKEEVPPPK